PGRAKAAPDRAGRGRPVRGRRWARGGPRRPRAGGAWQPLARPHGRRGRRRQGRGDRDRGRLVRADAGGAAMILGRVVGFVWATRKHARLERGKLLVVEPYGWY